MYRFHLDIPCGENEQEAITMGNMIIKFLQDNNFPFFVGNQIQCRLSKDEDRSIRNYLRKDQQGHATTKKTVIE